MSNAFMRALDRATAKTRHSISMMIGRCVLTAINDDSKVQTVQLTGLADEVLDRVERFQDYGFTSVPKSDAEGIVIFVGGSRGHGIVIATEDRRYRLVGLQAGEVALYDDMGQKVHLKRTGIEITSPIEVKVTAPKAVILSDDVNLGGEGGPAVARVGDAVAGGFITSGSAKVKAA